MIGVQVVLVGLALAVVVIETVSIFSGNYHRDVHADLTEEVTEYTRAAEFRPSGQSLFEFSRLYLETHSLAAGRGLVVEVDGSATLSSPLGSTLDKSSQLTGWLTEHPRTARYTSTSVGGRNFEVLLSPIVAGDQRVGLLVPFADLSQWRAEAARITRAAEIQAAMALAAAALSSLFVLRHLLRIVGRVTDAAEEIAGGDIDRRISYSGPDDEVGRLATSFDRMADRLASAMGGQRQLLSDVSHQLRTPLTVARGHLEVLLRSGAEANEEVNETVGLVIDELHHASQLVDRLLLLGRSLEPDFIVLDPLDVRSFMADLFEASTVLADREWKMAPVPDLVIDADAAKLRGAVLNLVDNAVKATERDDSITLSATVDRSTLALAVSDTGRGVPLDIQQCVFERFRRGDRPDERGSGLGLAIVRAVAEGHGGVCSMESEPGLGCTVVIALPLVPPTLSGSSSWLS